MNKPVSYLLAKLLKEKGYNIPVTNLYSNEELLENYSLINQYENLYIENKGECVVIPFNNRNIYLEKINFNSWSKTDYSAPDIADVVMWLYEKYDIWITVHQERCRNSLGWDFNFVFINDDHERTIKEQEILYKKFGERTFSSINEAYEADIEYTLTNLI